MKKLLIGVTVSAALGIVASANAADLPVKAPVVSPPPVYSWTGPYIGLAIGIGWTDQHASDDDSASDPGNGDLNGTGPIGGVYLGYNWQFSPNVIAGIEGDFMWTNLDDTAFDTNRAGGVVLPSGGITFAHHVSWLSSIRGRLGYALAPAWLLYGTGGFAFGKARYYTLDIHLAGPAFPATFETDKTRTGWVAGGGVEWAMDNNWLARAEYLHYDLSGDSASGIPRVGFPAELSTFDFSRLTIDTVRIGFAYKF